jgi:hypothetical protein
LLVQLTEHRRTEVTTDSSRPQGERRRKRSDDVVTALHYQLASARAEVGLEALVLVDDRGSLLASAGAWAPCEELAAFAPLLARPEDAQRGTVVGRLSALARETTSVAIDSLGAPLLLSGRGASAIAEKDAMLRVAAACVRILAA